MEGMIVGIAVVLAVVAFFIYASKSGAKMLKEQAERIAKAERGKAKILGFSMIGLSGTGSSGRYQAYRFSLEVSNAFKTPYKARSAWNVYPMGAPRVQVGMEVNVKIDVDDPNIIYPSVQDVEFSFMGMKLADRK